MRVDSKWCGEAGWPHRLRETPSTLERRCRGDRSVCPNPAPGGTSLQRECIDLKRCFGRQYRVRYEESYQAHYGPLARTPDPWLMIIPCRCGHIYPFGGDTLAASVDGFPKVAGRLKNLPRCRVYQDGDFGELTVLFDAADLPEVARIMQPRRRRRLSPEQRAQRAEHLARVRPKRVVDTVKTSV